MQQACHSIIIAGNILSKCAGDDIGDEFSAQVLQQGC